MKYLLPLLLLLLLVGCDTREGPLDFEGLSTRAKTGQAEAFRTLVELLGETQNDLNGRAYGVLMEQGVASIPYLLEKVDDPNDERREYVIAGLGTLKAEAAVTPIGAVLQNVGLNRRYVAAWALGEIGKDNGVPFLVAALDDPDGEVRKRATRSLIKLNKSALPALLDYLPSAPARGAAGAIRALGDIGDRRALPVLLQLLDSPMRREIFHALGKLKDPRAEQGLVAGLSDADWQNRMAAATALGPIGGPKAEAALRTTLDDEVEVVREWSARSLEMISGKRTLFRNSQGEMVLPYHIYH
ncbi:MAG: hypothetical protein C0616_06855 [Desulfuromonas sp.]|nr:MAG: hypothetical protein C0616_06855 [Desulfuromonas sp.]